MSFILPVVTSVVLFGSTFDLRNYQFENYQIYDRSVVPKYVQVADIGTFTAEYYLVDTFTEFRNVLGVDVATGLKALIDEFPYESVKNFDFAKTSENDVKIVIKLTLRTLNESLPYTAPTIDNWKSENRGALGSHYVKSMAYGADLFVILRIAGQNQQRTDGIKQSVKSRFGKSGIFESEFKDKFNEILREQGVGYTMDSFGTIPSHNLQLNNIEDALILKDNFREIATNGATDNGPAVSYEMQSLSFVDAEFPLVEINREILPILELVELKYEDLRAAYEDYISWRTEGAGRFISEENLSQEDAFYTSLTNAKETMEVAIGNMDITNTGDVNQFEEAFDAYGDSREETTKYREWLRQLKQIVQS